MHPYSGSPSSGMSFRPYYLAKNFNKLGYDTTVISSLNHHLSSFSGVDSGLNKIEGVDYYLVPTQKYKGNGLGRIINMLGFGFNLFKRSFRYFAKTKKPDVIIASTAHPFHTLAAKYFANKYNAKFILEVRDIWPLSLNQLAGVPKFHPLSILVYLFQKFGYKNCDHCVSLLNNAGNYFIKQGLKENSFTCIPNGVELIDSDEDVVMSQLSSIIDLSKQYETVIGYTGAIGIPNNMLPLIKAAANLEKHKIGIFLFGEGIEKNSLQTYCKENNLQNVTFFGHVAKSHIRSVISVCDAMFINAKPKSIYKYGISPNKIFDYMLENKMVFNGINSPSNPLSLAGNEILFKSNDHEDLANKIIQFSLNKESFKVDSKAIVEKNYSYIYLAQKYSELFKK